MAFAAVSYIGGAALIFFGLQRPSEDAGRAMVIQGIAAMFFGALYQGASAALDAIKDIAINSWRK